jgi:3-hydroxyisobutyrate dehydrogenase-like beta-hydroxyacid dehydrogenase
MDRSVPTLALQRDTDTIGWIGLGRIGLPMARRIQAGGWRLVLWARRPEAFEAWTGEPAERAVSLADLAERCSVICTCVAGPADVQALHATLMPSARPGTLFVDHSTVSPSTATAAAALARECGHASLDAPVTGGVAGAEKGSLTTFVGGDATARKRAEPLLAAHSSRVVATGDAGTGQRMKLLNQTLMAGSLMGLADAARLAQAAGLSAAELQAAVATGSGGSALLASQLPRMMPPGGPAGFGLGLLLKDLRLARDEASSLSVPTPLLDAAIAATEAAIGRHGEAAGIQMLAQP